MTIGRTSYVGTEYAIKVLWANVTCSPGDITTHLTAIDQSRISWLCSITYVVIVTLIVSNSVCRLTGSLRRLLLQATTMMRWLIAQENCCRA